MYKTEAEYDTLLDSLS